MFIKGKFVNADGLEEHDFFCFLEKSKQPDFYQAMEITKRAKSKQDRQSFLAVCSDPKGLIRVVSVEPRIYHHLAGISEESMGTYFNSLRQDNGMPLKMIDLVKRLPGRVTDAEIIKLAELHLAKNNGSVIGHRKA